MTETPNLEVTAREWVVRLVSGDVDQETLAGFKTWQAADVLHAEAFDRARRHYVDAGLHKGLIRPRKRVQGRQVVITGIAAVAAIFALAQAEILFPPDFAAPDGPARVIALSDGTRVILDGASALDVKIGREERVVTLRRGRAFFDVRHERRPFKVLSGKATVTDLGTAFTVADVGSGSNVVVEQGSVNVDLGGASRKLIAGQAVYWADDKLQMMRVDPSMQDWVIGQIRLRNMPFAQAAASLDRYIPGHVVVFGDLGTARVGGTFSTDNAMAGLKALAESQGASVRTFSGLVVVSRF